MVTTKPYLLAIYHTSVWGTCFNVAHAPWSSVFAVVQSVQEKYDEFSFGGIAKQAAVTPMFFFTRLCTAYLPLIKWCINIVKNPFHAVSVWFNYHPLYLGAKTSHFRLNLEFFCPVSMVTKWQHDDIFLTSVDMTWTFLLNWYIIEAHILLEGKIYKWPLLKEFIATIQLQQLALHMQPEHILIAAFHQSHCQSRGGAVW